MEALIENGTEVSAITKFKKLKFSEAEISQINQLHQPFFVAKSVNNSHALARSNTYGEIVSDSDFDADLQESQIFNQELRLWWSSEGLQSRGKLEDWKQDIVV